VASDAESQDFRLDGRTVARPVDLLGHVAVQVQVVGDDLGHGVVRESLVTGQLHGEGKNYFLAWQRGVVVSSPPTEKKIVG
jgi:hypothetical protein